MLTVEPSLLWLKLFMSRLMMFPEIEFSTQADEALSAKYSPDQLRALL